MRRGFYYSLACDGMKKNKKMYIPYILTCIGMVMMLYILLFLQTSDMLKNMRGGTTTAITLGLGSIVISIFSAIFLFYTNSFLMRRRRREFGLYNMLGMSKGNICRILIWETTITFIISVTVGIACGIAFSKLAELVLLKVLIGEAAYGMFISAKALLFTTLVFGVIFVLLLLNAMGQVRFSTAMALLQSENYGEKPPKANWLLGAGGFVVLAAAYYLAVSIESPLEAMVWFFIAVIMVIAATYMIFIAGMVLICKVLQNNKNYYYKANHFVSTSTMAYRMKRNGAGLASICILATMVLVMLSSTASLYFGAEDSLRDRYPREVVNTFWVDKNEELSENAFDKYTEITRNLAEKKGVMPQNEQNYRCISIYAKAKDRNKDFFKLADIDTGMSAYNELTRILFIPIEDYNKEKETNTELGTDEALIYTYRTGIASDRITVDGLKTYKIKDSVEFEEANALVSEEIIPAVVIITGDYDKIVTELDARITADSEGQRPLSKYIVYNFDTNGLTDEKQIDFGAEFASELSGAFLENGVSEISHITNTYANNRMDFYAAYGALFFLAIVLSIVFICAAVLIIYYKQVSEGYEDKNKFAIMQKVGMTKEEIRKSVNSQVLTVFFLPLVMAGIHMAFAFPMIKRILFLFNLSNTNLFVMTTAISYGAFALLYIIVYKITSKAYYDIVS